MSITANGIHIIGGQAAAGSFKHAYKMFDRLLIHGDILSCGPISYCTELHEWENIRIEYLKGLLNNWPDMDFKVHDMDLLRNIDRLTSADSIYIWISTGLED